MIVGGGFRAEPMVWRAGFGMWECSRLAMAVIMDEVVGERVRGVESVEVSEEVDMIQEVIVLHRELF